LREAVESRRLTMAGKKKSDLSQRLISYAIVAWIVASIWLAGELWSHLSHLTFLYVWVVSGCATACVALVSIVKARNKQSHFWLFLYVDLPVCVLLGPAAALGQVMTTAGDVCISFAKKIDERRSAA
jgi:hypothetical protein